jgi:C4-dicarboxylate transporter, DctM subunit
LFAAGVLPGLLTAVMFMAMIMIRVMIWPKLAPEVDRRPTMYERMVVLQKVWPLPVLVVGVLGGIYAGLFTPTEAGAVGSALAILIAVLQRRFTWPGFWRSAQQAATGTASIFIIAVGAGLFSRFMAFTGVPSFLADLLLGMGDSPLLLILQISVLYIILGMFIDSIGIMLLTLPILLPMLVAADVDLIWFGIIVIKLLEIGLVTPPVGLNVFVMKSSLGNLVELSQIFRGVMWFIAVDIVVLGLLIAFPQIALWLPSMM